VAHRCRIRAAIATLAITSAFSPGVRADDWPQWGGPRRDNVWRETGILDHFDGRELKSLWRVPVKPAFSGPAVANGKVYVTDRDAEKKTERVLCLDARTGQELWKHEYPCVYKKVNYDSGPRTTPTVHDGKVYTVGAMGNLFCLNAETGDVIWQKDYVADLEAKFGYWGCVSPPLIDGPRLIALTGGKNAAVVAFDKDTGQEIWRALSVKDPGYAPPIIIKAGGTRQLIIWHPEAVVSLDAETGAVYWELPFHSDNGLSICTPAFEDPLLFVSQSWNGPMMMELSSERPEARELYRVSKDGSVQNDLVNCLMCPPYLHDGYIYGIAAYGDLRCLKARTGERVWESRGPAGHGRCWNAFLVPNGERTFFANDQGELIIARISPKGYEEISRAKLIEPVSKIEGRMVVWSHPAFANKCIFARNDKEILCVSLAAGAQTQPAESEARTSRSE
jgi:outer membrane protein assembly factor BamB